MQQLPTESLQDAQEDLTKLMTIFYVVIQTALSNPLDEAAYHVNQGNSQ